MNPAAAAEALGSAGNTLFSSKSKSETTGPSASHTKVPIVSAKYTGQSSFNSDEDGVNSDEEGEIVRKNLRQKSTIFENGTELTQLNTSCHPGETVNYSLERANERRTLGEASSSRHSSASPTPSAPLSPTGASSTHSEESYAIPTISSGLGSATSPTNTSIGATSLVTPQHHPLYSHYAPPTNRNYSFLAGQTQVDNITRQNQPVAISTTENERLRKLKQKKENKDKKKDKNVNVYTTGPKNTENGTGTEFSIDKVLESLGEIKNDKQQNKKSQKTSKTSHVKQSNGTSTEKSKSQRRSYEKTSVPCSPEDTNERSASPEESNGHAKENGFESNAAKSVLQDQRRNKKDFENGKIADPVYDNPQVQKLLDFSRNFVLVDHDSNSPGDLKRQTSKSTENLFTTVLPKKQKNKKKSPATDADIHTVSGIGVSTNQRSYISNISQQNDPLRSRGTGSNVVNGPSNNRERGTMGNNGAKNSAASTNSGALSDTTSSHQEIVRTSSSSAALVNTDSSNKFFYSPQSQKQSTGTSSITSDSVTGESMSESTSLATDLDLTADFPPLGLNENPSINNSANVQTLGTGDEHPTTLMANRAPLPKAVWPIIRPNVSTSDSTAVIENIINTNTNVNENVNNNASETNNSDNAVVSPDVSFSSISTSSFTTVPSTISISNIPSPSNDAKSNSTCSSTNIASVAQGNGTQTIPSYSKALLGHNSSNKANANQPSKQMKKISNLPVTPPQQHNAMLIDENPPDITVQFPNVLKAQSSLPDVTAQAPRSTVRNSVNSTPNGDSGTNSPPPYIATTDLSSIGNPPCTNTVAVTDEYNEGIITPAMQQGNGNLHDSILSATFVHSSSPSSCFFVDDNRAVAIVLSERAYNNSHTVNNDGQNVNVGMANIGNEQHSNVPAVTILGRGETPVADWSSRCDGLEFGGPINQDLLSMEYATPYMEHQVINNYIQPHDSYYQEMLMTKDDSNMVMDSLCKNGNSEHITYKTQQCMEIQNVGQEEQIPLPDMDRAIVSFGESLEHANKMDSGINSSSQAAIQAFGADSNELNNIQDPNDNMHKVRDAHYERYENSEPINLSGLNVNTNLKYSEALPEHVPGNIISSHSVTSISPNSLEENDPQSVPLNNELNDYSATNWPHQLESLQIENETPPGEDQQSSPFIEGNLVYNSTAAINEANNKVNYNYQEILSFVSNSWQQVEKELTSGAPGKYYYSKSVSNNKNNSNIAKLNNNVQKH